MDVTQRSRHYSPEFRNEIATIGAVQLTIIATGWRENADDPTSPFDRAYSLALAAYFQSAAERRMRADMFHGTVDEYLARLTGIGNDCQVILNPRPAPIFLQYYPAQYIDNGGPCRHASPDGMFDDCLCKDDTYIPASIAEACTPDYCDGSPDHHASISLFGKPHVEHCDHYRSDPWSF